MDHQIIQKIIKENNDKFSSEKHCSCCNCITSFCYCLCQCKCHKEKIIPKNNKKIIYDDLPNLNIDELRMKSLKEYTSSNIMDNTKKALNSSRSMINFENIKKTDINEINSNFLNERNETNLKYSKNPYLNKSQEVNYSNNNRRRDKYNHENKYSERIKNNYNTLTDHYKTQSNFNNLKKYYQINGNRNDKAINSNLKSQFEFNKLLSSIKNDVTINKKKRLQNPNVMYNTYVKRENNFQSKINTPEINLNKIANISDNFSNGEKKTLTSNNFKTDKEDFKKNLLDFGFNTEYNRTFRPNNFNNKSINLNEDYMNVRNDNKNLTLDKYENSSKSFLESELNSYNSSQNGGDKENNRINNKQKLYNNKYINKIGNDKFLSDININNKYNLNDSNNINNTEPKETNQNLNKEKNEKNINSNFSKTNFNTKIENKRKELLESKDINLDNFVLTFGAKGNNEVKNIITSLKNELQSKNNKVNGNGNTDENINNIINDYEKLKKKYATNRLFTGLQNNINNLNGRINNFKENSSKNNTSKLSTSNFDINIKGELNKNSNEINDLKIELKEAKTKIEELTKLVLNYQKEIKTLKGQLKKSKRENLDNSKINTINNISTSNNNSISNKTKIGKNSFIIKIPDSLIKRRIKKDNQSRNNSLNEMTNSNLNNQENYEINTLLDLTDNTYKKSLFKNNSNNFNNISNISNKTNSNYLTNNNISNNNIGNYKPNNDIYTKKITTTMRKKFRKSASQKINKINPNIYIKPKDSKRISKLLYTIFTKNDKIKLLSFDMRKHKFKEVNFIDSDGFELDYKESFLKNKENNINICLNNEKNNDFYIVTGTNSDKLYKYDKETNKIKKLCKFENNHSNGCLLYINNKIICLSGNHNKKVEMFSEENNSVINLPEMNIERSSFSCCLVKNEYIFALFGYNLPTQQYLNTIEYYNLSELDNFMYNYININDDEWRYLKYKDNNLLNLGIKGHICFNYLDEKIIFFGGFNGYKNEAVDCFYQLNLPENFNSAEKNENCYIESLDKKVNDISKNRIYYFGNNTGLLFNFNKENIYFEAIDTNYYAHILDLNNFKHNIHYFH